MEKKKVRVVHKDFIVYDQEDMDAEMKEYIEDMYNHDNIEILNMQIVYQRTRFSENGCYRVIFVIRNK